jgi:hypothetical protein
MSVAVVEIDVADPPAAWTRAGFGVDPDGVCRIGGVRVRLVGDGRGTGIVGTVEALAAVGVAPRREREARVGSRPVRQIFFRFGEVILEVVGSPGAAGAGPSTLWGITHVVADIDATASFFGEHSTPVKDAVQPGRRITTLRHRDLGMSVRTAMISAPIVGA